MDALLIIKFDFFMINWLFKKSEDPKQASSFSVTSSVNTIEESYGDHASLMYSSLGALSP
jgi:hypothetical protein